MDLEMFNPTALVDRLIMVHRLVLGKERWMASSEERIRFPVTSDLLRAPSVVFGGGISDSMD